MVLLRHFYVRLIWSSRHYLDFTFCQLILALTNLNNLNCFSTVWIVFYSFFFIDVAWGLQATMVVYCWHRLFFNMSKRAVLIIPALLHQSFGLDVASWEHLKVDYGPWGQEIREKKTRKKKKKTKLFLGLESTNLHSYVAHHCIPTSHTCRSTRVKYEHIVEIWKTRTKNCISICCASQFFLRSFWFF